MPQMKCSQSMSSLATPENHRKSPTNTRLCSSSRKPRRTFEKKMWRRSWGSYERSYDDRGGGEDDVQMQEEEIHGNLISKVTVETNLGQFLEDYTVICDWLNYAQVQRGNSADAGTLSELGTELLRRQPWRIQINENAKSLLKSFPLLKEECGWRMRHLNSQWDALEKILLCQSPAVAVETGKKSGNDSGIDWLREWLSEMEDQLQPLDFRTQWNPELVKILVEHHKGLQSEIESKSDKVHESLRQFEESAREIAKKSRLEKRWWQLRLRVLEWIQHLEGVRINLNNQLKKGNKSIGRESVLSSDEETAEPLTKYRRLGNGDINSVATEEVHSNEEFNFIDEEKDVVMGQLHDDSVCITPQQSPLYTPTSGSSSSINSSHSSHTHSSSSSTSQNLKRKPTHKNYSKLPPFDHAPLSHAPFHLDDLLDGANISTYYFKHSEQKEMLSCQPTSHPPSGVAMETNSDTIAFSSGGEDKLDAVQSQNQSPSNVESENMDFNRGLTTMVAMETKNRIKLEKEIGDLVEKAEELAKRNFNGGDFLGGFISSGEDEECEDPVAIETSVSASAKIKDKSFAKLKEKFTKMEEILVETRKKIKSGGNCGGVVQSGGCDAGGVVGKKLKTARVRQWVRQNSKENSENHHGNAGRRFKPPPTTTPGGSCDASAESDSSSHFSSTSSDDPTTTTTSTLLLHQTQATLNFLRNRSSTSDDSAAEFVSKKKKPRPKSFEFHSSDTAAFLGGGGCGSDESLGRRKRVRKRGGRRKSDAGENVGVGVEKATPAIQSPNHHGNPLRPVFQISGPVSEKSPPPPLPLQTSDMGSLNTEQDWDSYQEKYLSEPYSEEAYDPNDTLKLLAFGEDYGQFLNQRPSSGSSFAGGFEKRRGGTKMSSTSSSSDSDEITQKSQTELNFVENLFKKFVATGDDCDFVTMETACLTALSSPTPLHTRWQTLHQKITETSRLTQISKEITDLKLNFSKFYTTFEHFEPFDSNDLGNLHHKIGNVQKMLQELMDRKLTLQNLNSVSMTTSKFFNQNQNQEIKNQLVELYQLYEENFQLGTYLLEKMRYLQEAWEKFEREKSEFERLMRPKFRIKDLNSAASTDSGHVTDDFHDSSVSDSDLEVERKLRLDNLKKSASEITSWLPESSPVVGFIEMRVHEAEKGFEDLRVINPKKSSWKPKKIIKNRRGKEIRRSPPRKWKLVSHVVGLNFALMGLFLAAAYFLHPNCCEFTNTFCFSLVPHLTHESRPPI